MTCKKVQSVQSVEIESESNSVSSIWCMLHFMVCELWVGFCFVESIAWFNGSPVRLHRPGGDESSSSGQDQDPNDPSDGHVLLLFCWILRTHF